MPQTWVVTAEEEPYSHRLGALVCLLRGGAGLSQRQLARAVGLSDRFLSHVELGRRRTRLSTLREVAAVLAPLVGRDREVVLGALVEAAGPALAAETGRSEGSIARKRKRKVREGVKVDTADVRRLLLGDAEPVKGGPEFMLRRRLNADLDRAFGPRSAQIPAQDE